MKRWSILPALSLAVASIFANPALPAKTLDDSLNPAKPLIQAKLVQPLEEKEAKRSRFSRAALPPQARRIRITDEAPQKDAQGRAFVSFAIDQTHALGNIDEIQEENWTKDAITGCAYLKSGEVLVRRGEVYYASSVLLGADAPAASAEVCHP